MTATVGVLCARVRVEEKQLLAALAEVGAVPTPLPPAAVPLPIGPVRPPSNASPAAPSATAPPSVAVLVDRCQDRATAAAILTAGRALGIRTLDAGLAAAGDRLAVATALAAAGLPRPETRLSCSPKAALRALDEFGYPGTLLPLTPGVAPVALLDPDAAEAVLEHRAVLGSARDALSLVQAGTPIGRATVVVVDGRAVAAIDADLLPPGGAALAEAAAAALAATMIGVEIALGPDGPIVWDVQAVPEYRHAVPLGEVTVAAALAAAALARLRADPPAPPPEPPPPPADDLRIGIAEPPRGWPHREVRDGVVLSA